MSQISTVPVFGLHDIQLGQGIVGGSLISYELTGTRAGELVLDILRGAKSLIISRVSALAFCTHVRLEAAQALEPEGGCPS